MAAPPGTQDLPRIVLGVLFILVIGVASLYILQPFLPAVIWATMIVVATWPFLVMLQARFGGSRTLAVTTMMLLLLVIVIAPLVMLITSIVGQAQHLSEMRGLEITIPGPPGWVASIPWVLGFWAIVVLLHAVAGAQQRVELWALLLCGAGLLTLSLWLSIQVPLLLVLLLIAAAALERCRVRAATS